MDKPIDVTDEQEIKEYPLIKNPDGSYMDEKQILEHLKENTKDKETIRIIANDFKPSEDSTPEDKWTYAFGRDSFGRHIRNNYGLWREDNLHTVNDPPPNKDGIIDHPNHPDNFSGRIIERLTKYFKNSVKEDENEKMVSR